MQLKIIMNPLFVLAATDTAHTEGPEVFTLKQCLRRGTVILLVFRDALTSD